MRGPIPQRHPPDGARPTPEGCERVQNRPDIDDLLLAAGRGDAQALAAFYDATAPLVFGLLHGALRNQARAEDATRQVYLQLWRTAPVYEPATGSAHALLMRTTLAELNARTNGILGHRRAATGLEEPRDTTPNAGS